jgi:hypothetical protein
MSKDRNFTISQKFDAVRVFPDTHWSSTSPNNPLPVVQVNVTAPGTQGVWVNLTVEEAELFASALVSAGKRSRKLAAKRVGSSTEPF